MPAVVAADAHRADVFLYRSPHHIPRAAMIAEINHIHAGADELEIDRVNGAVMPITDGNGGENTKRVFHYVARAARPCLFQLKKTRAGRPCHKVMASPRSLRRWSSNFRPC